MTFDNNGGKMTTFTNDAALIEAQKNLIIRAGRVNNEADYSVSTTGYSHSAPSVGDFNNNYNLEISYKTSSQSLTYTSSATIQSGAHMTIDSDHINNHHGTVYSSGSQSISNFHNHSVDTHDQYVDYKIVKEWYTTSPCESHFIWSWDCDTEHHYRPKLSSSVSTPPDSSTWR